jgi:hypothetical protein
MKKKEGLVPIGAKIFWGQTVMGILWIGVGLTGMFDNLICNILKILFLIAAIIVLFKIIRIGKIGDDGDEMAEHNFIKAQAKAGGALHMVLCIASMVFALGGGFVQNMDISWTRIISRIFFIFLGIHNLLIGLFFRKLEAE